MTVENKPHEKKFKVKKQTDQRPPKKKFLKMMKNSILFHFNEIEIRIK